jgi:hypothetical protein
MSMVPFLPLSRNDNSKEARMIKKFKYNVGNLKLIESVEEKRIDLSKSVRPELSLVKGKFKSGFNQLVLT